MADVEFEGDYKRTPQFTPSGALGQPQTSGMSGWLLKKGIIKDQSQAGGVLLGFVILNIIVTIFVVYYFLL